jgi:2-iminobutanoate/2-iminopropanoate deaminase
MALGPYTPAVRAGEWVVCSGQLGLVDGALADGVAGQVAQAVANLGNLLAEHGLSLADVVKTTVFMTDISAYAEMNEAYTSAFGGHAPARSAVAVAALPLGALVEIEAWAFGGDGAGRGS